MVKIFGDKQSSSNKYGKESSSMNYFDGGSCCCLKQKKTIHPKVDQANYHKLSFDELRTTFKTSLTDGLQESEAAALLQKNGRNILEQHSENVLLKILGYLLTGFCGVLWVGSVICILAWKPIGNPPDPTNLGLGILLIVVILLQALFSAFQDWSSSRVMKSIQNMMPSTATVIRNGHQYNILAADIAVGDLVILSYGSKVPADVRLLESHDLKFDRSMLTGESEHIDGTTECTDDNFFESKNIAFMTTLITNGQGKAIVVSTGQNTMMGKIAILSSNTKQDATSLQLEIRRFVILICVLAISTVVVLWIVWAAWLNVSFPSYINVSSMMVNSIGVLVGFIPTGLPVAVTLSLLLIARRMANSRILCKNLTTVETLSCVNVIASDKTGTLTQNKMFVSNASVAFQCMDLKDGDRSQKGPGIKQLLALSGLCINAKFEEDENEVNVPIAMRKTKGDATDSALLKFSTEYFEHKDFGNKYTTLADIPFNSRNKWMMKILKANDNELHKSVFANDKQDYMMVIKGAPDILLKKCGSMIDPDGNEIQFKESDRMEIIRQQNDWCMLGQRVLLLCKRGISLKETSIFSVSSQSEVEAFTNSLSDLCLVGMLGIIDPPREGIKDVIAKCRGAGIKVFMVTGDYALTAASIATEVGIFTNPTFDTIDFMREKHKKKLLNSDESITTEKPTSLLITGSDIDLLSDQDWRLITKYDEIVMARTTPEHKLMAVKELRKDGFVVGVTGDGVNDAPALKNADIGIAMGGGSEVAMDAAQLVLLDNNFNSILTAIENGRLVFDNLRKVILYLLPAGSFSEVIPVLTNMLLGIPLPLSAFLMICICILTDMSPSLALMVEKPETDLLKRPPRTKKDHLVNFQLMFQAYAFLGVIETITAHFLYFLYLYWYGGFLPGDIFLAFNNWSDGYKGYTIDQLNEFNYTGQTVFFVTLVMMQCFGNVYATRTNYHSVFSRPPFLKKSLNLWILAAQCVTVALMILIVFLPFANSVFNTRQIPVQFFFLPLAFALFILLADELRKLLVRKKILCFPKLAW